MIRLIVNIPQQPALTLDFVQPLIRIGRNQDNDLAVQADNVSGQHATIGLAGGQYVLTDQHSTNGTILLRGEQRYVLHGEAREMALEPRDTIYLASLDNALRVETIDLEPEEADETDFNQTILAEASSKSSELESMLGDDSAALRCAIVMAREMVTLENPRDIARLTCQTCLNAFPNARRAMFLIPKEQSFAISCVETRDTDSAREESIVVQARQLIDRCLAERKGFLFLFQQNQMQAVATMIASVEALDTGASLRDRVILCCPLFHQDRCYGFIEVDAPLTGDHKQKLTRQDLSLATLISHLIAARLYDLETQRERLKLARKATAGYMAAMVGHCFKNLLFVPMSLSRMLPLCLREGKMDEVEWMLARNGVNIRYLDMLSNEFAAASKDPNEGFEACDMKRLLEEVAELIDGIAPDKLECKLDLPGELPEIVCHGAALKRLLMNLTLNAVDALFGRQGGVKGVITLKGEMLPSGDEFLLRVEDNGPGIPQPILANLREIYQRVMSSADALGELQGIAEQVRSTKDQGFKEHYGLGFLFVCQTIQQHRGQMRIDAEDGKGTWFTITIPRTRDITGTRHLEPAQE